MAQVSDNGSILPRKLTGVQEIHLRLYPYASIPTPTPTPTPNPYAPQEIHLRLHP